MQMKHIRVQNSIVSKSQIQELIFILELFLNPQIA